MRLASGRASGHKTCFNTKMEGDIIERDLVGADPGPSTCEQGHSIGAGPGPVLSSEQGHSTGANLGPVLSGDEGYGKKIIMSGRQKVRDSQKRRGEAGSEKVTLRVGTVNVGTLKGRSGEVVDMAGRRKLDICCLQETRWRGGSARTMGGTDARYKLFWSGCDSGTAGVGVLVAEKWVDSVVEVRRVSERLMVVRVAVGKTILNVVSVYAPQVGRPAAEKEELLATLGQILDKIGGEEGLVVGGDMNCHVGAGSDGFQAVHGGRGYGVRNEEGEMLLEFATAMELAVANTWFIKSDSKKITYDSGGCRTVVDHVMVRRSDLKMVRDVKVIPGESCLPQHKLLVCVLDVKASVRKKKRAFRSKMKLWRLKEGAIRREFENQVKAGSATRTVGGDVDVMWKELKSSLMNAADGLCSCTKGPPRHKETWWWNEEVSQAIEEKRKLYLAWRKLDNVASRDAYYKAKRHARRVISKAQARQREDLAENLKTAEGKGKLFRAVKKMAKKNEDVVGGGCVKNKEGKVVTEGEDMKEVWRAYFEKLLNEEFQWDRNGLEKDEAVSGPCDCINREEVRAALVSAKTGKAAGPSGVVVEMLLASGEIGLQWMTDICNAIVREGKIPDDWRKSWIVTIYKGKGDALECGSYRGVKLLDQVMKIFERVIERRVRERVTIDNMQFGFRSGRGTTDAIFIVRQVQEKFLAKDKELWMAFIDLEKAFDRVPREVLWWALRQAGVEEWIVTVIKAMYSSASTAVKLQDCESSEFEVKVGVHQGSVLSPLLFIIVLEELAKSFREGLPWELLYADDLVLLAESEERLLEKIKCWKHGMEAKGLRVNMVKTKVMRCQRKSGQVEETGKWPCGVCKKGVGRNSVLCKECRKWVHFRCSGLVGALKDENVNFTCPKCVGRDMGEIEDRRVVDLGSAGKLEIVDKFCYLGDMIGYGGGAEEASRTRVRCAWAKFRSLMPILTMRGASAKMKGKIYRACVQSVMVYGSETWASKIEDMRRLERTERLMVRLMCGVTLKDKKCSEELLDHLGIESVLDVVRRGRLRWFGHLERMNTEDWVSACRVMEVEGRRGCGRGRKTWQECINEDMKVLKVKREDAQDRVTWRRAILGNRLTRASADTQT